MNSVLKISIWALLLSSIVGISACREADDGKPPAEKKNDESTYDVDANGIPKFLSSYISIEQVKRVSKFRSGVGHDYSDDFETCRSMKHYFDVEAGTKVFSPLMGKVAFIRKEWAGHKITITSGEYPAFMVEIFHLELEKPDLKVGDEVPEGTLLGKHISNSTSSDIAIMVQTPHNGPVNDSLPRTNGIKLVSYFDALKESEFQKFNSRHSEILVPDSFIITKNVRDAEHFNCDTDWKFGGDRQHYWIDF